MKQFFLNIFQQRLFFLSFLISLVFFLFIYNSLYQFKLFNENKNLFVLILVLSFFIILSLFNVFFKNFLDIFNNLKLKKAGQELQKKILVIFSAITLTPTLLIAFFSILIPSSFWAFITAIQSSRSMITFPVGDHSDTIAEEA